MRRWIVVLCMVIAGLAGVSTEGALAQVNRGPNLSIMAGGHLFEGPQNLEHSPTYGLGLGYNFPGHLGIEGLFNFTDTEMSHAPSTAVDVYSLRMEMLYHFRPEKRFVPLLALGGGVLRRDPAGMDFDSDALVTYGIGFKYYASAGTAFRLDARHAIDINADDDDRSSDELHNLIYTAGLTFDFGAAPALVKPAVKVEPVLRIEPAEPVAEPQAVAAAAPAVEPEPTVPAEPQPAPAPVAEVAAVPVTAVPVDTDGDGVEDGLDKCAGTPAGVKVDARGCAAVPEKPLELTLDIQFAPGRSDITREHPPQLAKAASFIRNFPGCRVVIEGHTDSVGPAAANLELSRKRAESALNYLVENFDLDVAQVEARGYGEAQPVADNASQAGRKLNRRVVVRIIR